MGRCAGNGVKSRAEKYKIATMVVLLGGACLLTYYFQIVLKIGTVFTHFFYIPIILSAWWWKRKGLIVVAFLAGLLIFSHIFLRADAHGTNDYLRALMFIVTALVVVVLSEHIVKVRDALKLERDTFQAVFNGLARAEIGVDIVGIDYKVHFQNQVLKERFGDLSGKLCYENYMGLKKPCDFCPMRKSVKNSKIESIELTAIDGRNYELLSAPLSNPGGTVDKVIEVVRDITKHKRTEEQTQHARIALEHSARLAMAGEMASGFAHELNQPLCAVLNYTNACLQMIGTGTANSAKFIDALEQIASQTERMGQIIQRIRHLVNNHEPRKSTVDVNETVLEIVSLEESEASQKGISVQTELAEDFPLILADRIQLQQVVLNLVRNAFEAMSETAIDQRQLTIQTSMAGGDAIEVAIHDTGRGLSPETVEKIFDSFFTTKTGGLGIGLSISRSIIASHGGNLWAEPNPDTGATFRFTLPSKGAEYEQVRADSICCG